MKLSEWDSHHRWSSATSSEFPKLFCIDNCNSSANVCGVGHSSALDFVCGLVRAGAVQLIQAVEWNKFCQKAFCSQIACFPHAFLEMFLNLVLQPRPLLRQKRCSPRLLAACASPEATVTFVFSTAFKMNATIFCSFVGFWWSNVWLKILWYKVCFQRFLNFELYWIEAYPHYFQMYLIESSFRE